MKRLKRYSKQGRSIGHCVRCADYPVVRDGLAYSPADMERLTARGMPVNSLNTQATWIDGEQNPSFDVTSDRQRFVDVADLWEQHVDLKEKARKAAIARNKQLKKKSNG